MLKTFLRTIYEKVAVLPWCLKWNIEIMECEIIQVWAGVVTTFVQQMAAVPRDVQRCLYACVLFLLHYRALSCVLLHFILAFLYLTSLSCFLSIISSQQVSSPSYGMLVYCSVAHHLKQTSVTFLNDDDDDALCISFCFQADYISRVPHATGGFPNGCPCLSP